MKLERIECVPTSSAVKPSLTFPIEATVDRMCWRISFWVIKCNGASLDGLNVFTARPRCDPS